MEANFEATTGLGNVFDHDLFISKEITKGSLEFMHNNKLIEDDEYNTLKMMVQAGDADYTVAEMIINQKANEFQI